MVNALRDPSLASEEFMMSDDPRMPVRLRDLKASSLSLMPKEGEAKLEFGGGFYHYGYQVNSAGGNSYRIVCYGENVEDVDDLGTFQYSQGEQGTDDQLPARADASAE